MRRKGLCGCSRVRMRSHGGKWALIQCDTRECSVTQSCPTPGDPVDPCPSGSFVHGIFFLARILEWVAHFLLHGIFLTQGSKPHLHLLHCRQILYHWAMTNAQYDGWASLRRDRRHTGRVSCDQSSSDQRDTVPRKHQGPGPTPVAQRRGERVPPRVLEGARPCWQLALGLLASRTVMEDISTILNHRACGMLPQQLSETNTHWRKYDRNRTLFLL